MDRDGSRLFIGWQILDWNQSEIEGKGFQDILPNLSDTCKKGYQGSNINKDFIVNLNLLPPLDKLAEIT